tara:strand:+ start:1407 stop:1976 length:570 start_codon:yes stop_codon:yes gene_type:complete
MPKGRVKGTTYKKLSAYDKDKIVERFLLKINKDTDTGCWLWTGWRSQENYGGFYCMYEGKGKIYPAHRFSYMIHNNGIPDGLQILHKCNNKPCVNPEHLYAGTHLDNMKDLRDAGTLKGKNNPNYGVKCTEEKRRKLSKASIEAWKREDVRKKIIESLTGKKRSKESIEKQIATRFKNIEKQKILEGEL